MNINITLDPTKGDQAKQLEDAMAALGFVRALGKVYRAEPIDVARPPEDLTIPTPEEAKEFLKRHGPFSAASAMPTEAPPVDTEGLFTLSDGAAGERLENLIENLSHDLVAAGETERDVMLETARQKATRVPGQPSPGRKRRTKEEMAEDEAFNLAAGKELAALPFAPVPDAAAISTGNERVDPAVAAQDRADEKAEAQSRKGDKLTLEDVRDAVAEYTAAPGVGIPVAQRRVPEILGCPIIAIPGTQEALAKAVAAIRAATRAATKGDASAPVEAPQASLFVEPEASLFAEPEPPKKTFAELIAEALKPDDVHATMNDCVEACQAYAMRYAGTVELAKAPCVQEDIPRVLEQALGIRQIGPSMNPKQLGRALTAINVAVTTDPFNRGVKKG